MLPVAVWAPLPPASPPTWPLLPETNHSGLELGLDFPGGESRP